MERAKRVIEGEAPAALLLEGATLAPSIARMELAKRIIEGEAPAALLLEGATLAPSIEVRDV